MNHGYFHRELPDALADLPELAFDLRWNDCPAARHLWSRFDPEMWERTENPFLVLQSARQEQIDAAATDATLLRELAEWRSEVDEYYSTEPEFRSLDPDGTLKTVAYFSMEFGLSEALPIYSGGLGMLAGDHLKTASDLGVPLVGIGLLYQQGYFRQVIGDSGEQLEAYPFNDPGSLPVRPVAEAGGHWLRVKLPLPGRSLYLRVWEARVGRVRLLLLDSNDALNTAWDRGITAQLYDAGRDKRLLQEIVLGVGGWRLIEQLGLDVDVCHLNEGHAAFAVLARAAGFSRRTGLPLGEAFTATKAGNVFTTHTPVEAAFDRFDVQLLTKYAQPFLDEVGLPIQHVLALGRANPGDDTEPFNMAWLAMHGCCHVNAVSRLHGEVSRSLFSSLFPRWPRHEVPVRAITNGVHVPTWATRRAAKLWGDECGGHLWLDGLRHVADQILALPPEDLWAFRTEQRQALLREIDARSAFMTRSETHSTVTGVPLDSLLDPNVLTIGFARRFATYKRATLLLSDPERLTRLLLDEHRPVQLVVAGKAHPNDRYGKELVQKMTQFLGQPELRGRAVFLEDYDMVLGQHLVGGVDVWLNTPLRPNEACGTSGMKVLVNGGLNVSVLDGWWDEAVAAGEPPDDSQQPLRPGWIVGNRESSGFEEAGPRDATSLFDVLENEVIPEFYDRDEDGIPHRWINRVKLSMAGLTPRFSATRMLHEYVAHAYLPAARAYTARSVNGAKLATEIRQWSEHLRTHWAHVRIGQVRCHENAGGRTVSVDCWLDDIPSEYVRVAFYAEGTDDQTPTIVELTRADELPGAVNGFRFTGEIPADRPLGDFTARIIPHHPAAFVPIENDCILWDH
jgi:starch phosphorylase